MCNRNQLFKLYATSIQNWKHSAPISFKPLIILSFPVHFKLNFQHEPLSRTYASDPHDYLHNVHAFLQNLHLCIYCAQLAVSHAPKTQAAPNWLIKSHSQRKQANYNEALTECLHTWGKHAVVRAKEKECQGGRWLNLYIPRRHFS